MAKEGRAATPNSPGTGGPGCRPRLQYQRRRVLARPDLSGRGAQTRVPLASRGLRVVDGLEMLHFVGAHPEHSSRSSHGADDGAGTARFGRHRRRRAQRGAERAAAGASVESAVLRRPRHAHRADGTWFYLKTPIGRPALVKLFASVLKREGDKLFPRHAGREMRDRGRRRAVPRGRDAGGARRSRPGCCISAPMSTTGWPAGASMRCASSRSANRRAQALSARAARSVGEGDAGAVLRSRRARRGARRRRRAHVRRRLGGRVLRHGAGRKLEGLWL